VFVADREHGGARFFDADTGAPVPAPDGVDTVSPSLLASAPDGSRLAAYGADGLIHLLPNRPSGTAAVAPLRPQMRNVHDLFWLDGGRFLVAVGVNHAPAGESPLAAVQLPTAQVWDLSGAGRDCVFTGRKRTAWRFGHGGWVFVTDRTPPLGDFAPRTTRNREVRHEARLLDLRSGQEWVLPGAETTFLDCAFSDDGRYLATVAVFAPTLGVAVVSPMPPRQVTVWRLPDRR
jgi:WD40 repeat protein